jgi:hypothetical protein
MAQRLAIPWSSTNLFRSRRNLVARSGNLLRQQTETPGTVRCKQFSPELEHHEQKSHQSDAISHVFLSKRD